MATAGSTVGRAAAILTTGEVFGADCDLSDSLDGKVAVVLSFTLGSLTSCTWRAYAGATATPTSTLAPNGVVATGSLTGNTSTTLVFDCAGAKYFRLSLQGVGTVTSSTANFTYYYNDYESTSRDNGELVVGD